VVHCLFNIAIGSNFFSKLIVGKRIQILGERLAQAIELHAGI
jgi:hypothetical protein